MTQKKKNIKYEKTMKLVPLHVLSASFKKNF